MQGQPTCQRVAWRNIYSLEHTPDFMGLVECCYRTCHGQVRQFDKLGFGYILVYKMTHDTGKIYYSFGRTVILETISMQMKLVTGKIFLSVYSST